MDPCQQASEIGKLHQKLDRVGEALQVLAVQKNEIEHLIRGQGDHREWLKGHEDRIRDIERQPGRFAVSVLVLIATAGSSVFSGVVVYFATKG